MTEENNRGFLAELQTAKRENKMRLAAIIKKETGLDVALDSMFDCHVKRIHEYKRQLLNIMHVIWLYNQIKKVCMYMIQYNTIQYNTHFSIQSLTRCDFLCLAF